MSSSRDRHDRPGLREEDWLAPAPAEDDWFSEDEAPTRVEDEWFVPLEPPPAPRGRRGAVEPGRRIALGIVVAVLAIGLLAAGILLVRAFGGDDAEPTATVPVTPTVPVPTTTEPATTGPATTGPATTEPASSITVPQDVTLRRGDEGANVEVLQQALAELGFDPGTIDGNFGPVTEQAVVAFQADAGLEQDGVAGPKTLAALADALAGG